MKRHRWRDEEVVLEMRSSRWTEEQNDTWEGWIDSLESEDGKRGGSYNDRNWVIVERERERDHSGEWKQQQLFFMMQLFFFSIHTAGTRHSALLGSCAAFRCLLSFVMLPGSRQCSSLPHSNTRCMACCENHTDEEASFHTDHSAGLVSFFRMYYY